MNKVKNITLSAVAIALAAFLDWGLVQTQTQDANAATILEISSNTQTGQLITNTLTTPFVGSSQTVASVILEISSNLTTGVLTTNSNTVVTAQVLAYPNGFGWDVGRSNSTLGFFGTLPTTQQVNGAYATNGVTTAILAAIVSQMQSNLNALGLTH